VKQQPDGIFISQDKYVADILKKFDFCSIKTATTPIESNKPLVKDEDGVEVDVHEYQSMIGSFMYLTASRPDIIFAVYACNTSGSAKDSMQLKELMVLVPTLVTRINSLEKELKETKQTLGNAVAKLVKKVKSLETALKRKSKKVIVSKSESEEPEDQGRIIQDIDDDPLVSLVRKSIKKKTTNFVTPTKASWEAQEEEISPTILEATKILSKVAS
ncbi:hypothetical protein Tco_1230455, partial [Tanacetum coccineum]